MGIVFVSYSHKDSKTATAITRVLDSLDVSYFLDRKTMKLGQVIDDEVRVALHNCAVVLVVISPASLESEWVPYEIGHAVALRKVVLPFKTHPSLRLPDYLSKVVYSTTIGEVRDYFSKNKFPFDASTTAETLNRGVLEIADWHSDALAGRWTGQAHQQGGPGGHPASFKVDLKLRSIDHSVEGEMVLASKVDGILRNGKFKITGGFVGGRFCWVNYVAKSSVRPHFGSVVFELSPDSDKANSDKLVGHYVGYGAYGDRVVTGFAELTRHHVRARDRRR